MDQNKNNETPTVFNTEENADSQELGYQLGQMLTPEQTAGDYKVLNEKRKNKFRIKMIVGGLVACFIVFCIFTFASFSSGTGNITKTPPENPSKAMKVLLDEHAALSLGNSIEHTYQDAGCGNSIFGGQRFCNRRIDATYSSKTLPQVNQLLQKRGWTLKETTGDFTYASKTVDTYDLWIEVYRDLPTIGQIEFKLETDN